jgi:N-acetylmuramoyl-L-alanine amidase
MRGITHIVIHCSATPNGDQVTLLDIDKMHRARGWQKVGYHFIIEVGGRVVVGRQLEEIGAHVAGSNAFSIGICMIGTDAFSAAQWESLKALVESLTARFRAAIVVGHRDFSPDKDGDGVIEPWEWLKTCPGFDVKAWRLAGMEPLPAHIHREATAT